MTFTTPPSAPEPWWTPSVPRTTSIARDPLGRDRGEVDAAARGRVERHAVEEHLHLVGARAADRHRRRAGPMPPCSVTATPGEVARSSAAPFASPANVRRLRPWSPPRPGAARRRRAAARAADDVPRRGRRGPARRPCGGGLLRRSQRARARRASEERGGGRRGARGDHGFVASPSDARNERPRTIRDPRSEGGLLAPGVEGAPPSSACDLPLAERESGHRLQAFSPATVAGPRRTSTGFPVPPSGCCIVRGTRSAGAVKRSLARDAPLWFGWRRS